MMWKRLELQKMNGMTRTIRKISGLLATLPLLLVISSCASIHSIIEPPVPPLSGQPVRLLEDADVLRLSDEMKRFVDDTLAGHSTDDDRAWALAWAMLDPNFMDFSYEPRATLTAEEAFRQRRGNCLTFSNMFVAMARYAGIDTWYREVETDPEWSSVDETLLVSRYVNAAAVFRGNEYVIDVSGRPVRPTERHRRLHDDEAEAQYYNNLGANALLAGDLPLAHAWFRKAIETRPGQAYAWSNLGVVLKRNGQLDEAIDAYRTALTLDSRNSVAMNNLYAMYEELGEMDKAAEMQERVERNRRRNPYYLHHLAQVAFAEQDWDEAIRQTRRAIRLQKQEYRFHYTLAQLYYRNGELARAETSLNRAVGLAPDWVETDALVLPGQPPELPVEQEQ